MNCIRIDRIRLDGGTQPRGRLDPSQIGNYVEDMKDGMTFPAVEICYDGTDYWLWDGFHRVHAARILGLDEIDANVTQGTQKDAQWLSYSANKAHGLHRSNGDKQRAVLASLGHPKAESLSNPQIAEHCGVSVNTVAKYRERLEATCQIDKSARRTGRDGRTINTTRIGKRSSKRGRKRTWGGIAKDAFKPVLGHSNPPPMVPLSLPRNNSEIAANTLIELFDETWLTALVERIHTHLQSKNPQEGERT